MMSLYVRDNELHVAGSGSKLPSSLVSTSTQIRSPQIPTNHSDQLHWLILPAIDDAIRQRRTTLSLSLRHLTVAVNTSCINQLLTPRCQYLNNVQKSKQNKKIWFLMIKRATCFQNLQI